jgi:prolipoprotein diacylglyceryltransferase
VLWTADRLGIIAPMSGAMIRLGNLFNSEIIGNETTVPWGFKFMRLYPNLPENLVPVRHATQLYEALCYIVTFAVLMWVYHKTEAERRRGLLFGLALIGIFLSRFIIEFVKIPQVGFEDGMVIDMGQILSIPFIILGVYMIIRAMRRPAVVDINAVVDHANKMYAAEDKKRNKRDGKRGK